MTFSRFRTRSALDANSGRLASKPKAEVKAAHSFSLPTLICTRPWRQWNSPYGAMDGWWLPWALGTSPATVARVPWNACTPISAASSEVRTICPWPVRSRCSSAASVPNAPYMPESRSAMGTPTRCGSSGPEPVRDIRPASPWRIWS
ncbi:hypothetical protein D9M69_636500 [compost metagenome]